MPGPTGRKDMGPLLASQTRPGPDSAWLGLILAASVLSACLPPAGAGIGVTIRREPPAPDVGGNVTLVVELALQAKKLLVCSWYRGAESTNATNWILSYAPTGSPQKFYGPARTGRETVGPGCSLHIMGLRRTDAGSYTLTIQGAGYNEAFTMSVYLSDRKLTGSLFIIAVVVPLAALVCLALLVTFVLYKKCRGSGASNRSETPGEKTGIVPK